MKFIMMVYGSWEEILTLSLILPKERGLLFALENFNGLNLIDLPYSGNRFSWYSGDDKSMSMLDIFLLDDAIIDTWGVVGQSIGKRIFRITV